MLEHEENLKKQEVTDSMVADLQLANFINFLSGVELMYMSYDGELSDSEVQKYLEMPVFNNCTESDIRGLTNIIANNKLVG
jgi:hypothetical protein